MNIVILHCHFERGGVTQVVENHVRWLRDCDEVDRIVLVSGERVGGLSESISDSSQHLVVPDFDYDAQPYTVDALRDRRSALVQDLTRQLASMGLSEENCVLHWHNHGLGKNTAAPAAIHELAVAGWRVLLQIHDFAEDNRPTNYRGLVTASGAADKSAMDRYLYPVAAQIHYATLTRADAAVLNQLGVPETQTHCLPNSVVLFDNQNLEHEASLANVRRSLGLPDDSRWCIYPVRGIRRKNVGEFLLLSRWLSDTQYAGLTLTPSTPVERRSYERWKQLAPQVSPRAVFDAGEHPDVSFIQNMSATDFILSTSVAEGFGMAFLEPWLMERNVIARRLPTVTDDFQQGGVELPNLYDSIPIVGDHDWISACRAERDAKREMAWAGLPTPFRPRLDSVGGDTANQIDFATLTPARQIEVLRRVAQDAGFESAIQSESAALVEWLTTPADKQLVQRNAEVVKSKYSAQETGRKLVAIYQTLASAQCDTTIEPPARAGSGIDLIANERPFYPCRTEVIDE